jgi:hypothetical protein
MRTTSRDIAKLFHSIRARLHSMHGVTFFTLPILPLNMFLTPAIPTRHVSELNSYIDFCTTL